MRYIRFGSRNHALWWLLAPCEPSKVVAIGLNHVAHAEVMVRAKELSVQVQNFNYHRTN